MATYLRPATLAEALEALATGPRTILAGATDHYPARIGRVVDEDIVDISAIAGSRDVRETGDGTWIPFGATWTDLVERPLPAAFDGLKAAARSIGGLQIENRGTIVGNVCNASPAADGMPNLLTLDAEVELVSVRGARRVPIGAFVTGNRTTVRMSDELVTGIWVPDPTLRTGAADGRPAANEMVARSTFLKLGARAHLVISIAMVAAVIVRDARGVIVSARIAVGACSAVAQRLPALESELVGAPLRAGIGELVRPGQLAALAPIDDVRASRAYRLAAAETVVRRAVEELAS